MEFAIPGNLFNDPRLKGPGNPFPSLPEKFLYFDVETTGTNPVVHDIVQYSALAITPEGEDEINIKMRPLNPATIEPEALRVQNRTRKEVLSWPDPKKQFLVLDEWLENHIDRFDGEDKFIPVAFNASFDLSFWTEYTVKCTGSRKYTIGSWVKRACTQDPLAILRFLERLRIIPALESHKLSSVCDFFGIPLKAHDAMEDVRALRSLDRLLAGLVSEIAEVERNNES